MYHTRIPASVWQAEASRAGRALLCVFYCKLKSFVCISLPLEEAVGMSGAEERDPLFISCTPHKP